MGHDGNATLHESPCQIELNLEYSGAALSLESRGLLSPKAGYFVVHEHMDKLPACLVNPHAAYTEPQSK
jgi:hypothetical protein